ncbi:MAG TPA: haloacid dehalogenase-like hydrolase [Candidatus Elarobacter sp.]|nr:haloacid dehalogenase-like hydrolase [Candidatus Elarobacter sp.]
MSHGVGLQVVVDWDGTVTERDSLVLVLQRFLPPSVFEPLMAETDAGMAARTLTHRAVMEREWSTMTASLDEVVSYLLETVRVRPGFAEFVQRFDPLILSSSFHETIDPILAREGVRARVKANHVEARPDGWRIRWVSDSACDACGEPCKRNALPNGPLVYVGDGYSDRCAALVADRIFARDTLARYLNDQHVRYEPFTNFHALSAALS